MVKRFLHLLLLISIQHPLFAQWTPLGNYSIPDLYRVWSIKIAEDNSIWAFSTYDNFPPPLAHSPTVSRSADGGATWSESQVEGTGGMYANDIAAIDSLRAFITIEKLNGLYKTEDGGLNWENVSGFPYLPFLVHFFNENEGWVLSVDTISPFIKVFSVTEDGGITWLHFGGNSWAQPPGTSLPPALFNDFYAFTYSVESLYDVAGENIILGKADGNCWLSKDKGYNWAEVVTPLQGDGLLVSNVSIKDDQTFIVVGDTESSTYAAKPTKSYTTIDGGQNWIPGSPGVTAGATHYIPYSDSAIITVGHNNFGFGAFGTAISYNFGADWEHIDDNRLLAMDFNSAGKGVAACCHGQWPTAVGAVYQWELPLAVSESTLGTIKLSPNPVTDILYLQLPEHITEATTIDLFDVRGKVVGQQSFTPGQVVEVAHLPSGFYTLKLRYGERVYFGKFIKQ